MSTELEYDDLHSETSHWTMTLMLGGLLGQVDLNLESFVPLELP